MKTKTKIRHILNFIKQADFFSRESTTTIFLVVNIARYIKTLCKNVLCP
jgi:hypothetical protein